MQINLFQEIYPTFKFNTNEPLRLVHLFSGIGFVEMGFKLAEIPFETVAIAEIDDFAIKAYNNIHGNTNNLGSVTDIKGIDIPQDIDMFAYGFPCQDLSIAGARKGLEGSRSGLVYEVLRILQELKELNNLPKVLIMENVTALIHATFIQGFQEIQLELEALGYTNYTDTLNAKDYGIAQNRDRVFMVSILGEYNYDFPKPFELKFRLKDYLEDSVDENFYLTDKMMAYLTDSVDRNGYVRKDRFKPHNIDESEYAYSITTNTGNRVTDNFLLLPEATNKGYAEAYEGDGVYYNRPHQKRGVVQKGMIQTLKTSGNDVGAVVATKQGLRIRKLTPIETGRLMGMNDTQIAEQRSVMSNTQMYKQHGNGIATTVIGLIVGMLWHEDEAKLRETVMGNAHLWTRGGRGWGDCIRNTNKR